MFNGKNNDLKDFLDFFEIDKQGHSHVYLR